MSSYIARAIFQDLRANGFDAFIDVESIESGEFDRIILNQIGARAHFLLILTPGTAERFVEPDDWLRREIEYAIERERNIIPLLVNDFRFLDYAEYFTGKLASVLDMESIRIFHEYFDAAMEQLRGRLSTPQADYPIADVSPALAHIVEQRIHTVLIASQITEKELTAEAYFSRGLARVLNDSDVRGLLDLYRAIQLDSEYVHAQIRRLINAKLDRNSSVIHVFLSHSTEDLAMMKRIQDTLVAGDLHVWIAENIEPGNESWKRTIQNAIEQAGCMAVIGQVQKFL